MLNKNIFYLNSKKFYKNLEKIKKIFNSLKQDLINSAIPLLQCYEKNYIFDFTPTTIKKFSKFKNIVSDVEIFTRTNILNSNKTSLQDILKSSTNVNHSGVSSRPRYFQIRVNSLKDAAGRSRAC